MGVQPETDFSMLVPDTDLDISDTYVSIEKLKI